MRFFPPTPVNGSTALCATIRRSDFRTGKTKVPGKVGGFRAFRGFRGHWDGWRGQKLSWALVDTTFCGPLLRSTTRLQNRSRRPARRRDQNLREGAAGRRRGQRGAHSVSRKAPQNTPKVDSAGVRILQPPQADRHRGGDSHPDRRIAPGRSLITPRRTAYTPRYAQSACSAYCLLPTAVGAVPVAQVRRRI